jgi:hypothetical protein
MKIEVSIGEIVDKYTILTLKTMYITNESKVVNVMKEWNYISDTLKEKPEVTVDELTGELLKVNGDLWKVEDDLRDLERQGEFGIEFIELARSVYKLNDERANIKKKINIKYGSKFIEEKSYQPY